MGLYMKLSYNMTHYIEHYNIAYQGAGMLQ